MLPLRPTARKRGVLLGVTALAAAGTLAYALWPAQRLSAEGGSFVRDGEAGFVVTDFAYALGPDTQDTKACPNGMSWDVSQAFAATPEGKRRPGEDDEAYGKRLEDGGKRLSATPDGKNYCLHPELAPTDVHAQVLAHPDARADGIDLDGKISRSPADARSGRLDFVGRDGAKGVDNQFWRAVGCNRSYQSAGQSNGFAVEMYTGSWGILFKLADVDDLRNDDDVEVGIFANADPIQLSPTRKALEYATYAMDQDPRFRASTRGRIVDGMLTTDPVDVRFHHVVNGMYLERPLRDAQIKATLTPQGVLKGYLAGYTPVVELYDYQFGFRNAKDAAGKPSPPGRILGSSNGAARVLGHTCPGIWQSLHRLADGHPDPASSAFTSISTQYRFEARPAFVVDVETRGSNDKLVRND
ncbi:hypothetical protein [Novosphingobium sp. M1R2S20]|uniref:Uncharacterized protein n=1 Tax=Novosphingobium rhizovicinum TaxID=3228928 RepID=A0ABV3REY1_9SPHN